MAPTAPPEDPDALDEYVRETVRARSRRFDRFEVEEIEYVRTYRTPATGGAVHHENVEVLFVQVTGHFVISPIWAPRRPGRPPKTAEVRLLSWTVDARTGAGLDGGLGGTRIDMTRLGEVRRPAP